MRIGKLRDQVTIQRETRPAGFGKAGQEAWAIVEAGVWAEVQDMLPSRGERLVDGLSIATRPARVRMRHRTDVTAGMRILFGDRVMQIVTPPATIERGTGIEFVAADYSTTGGTP